MEYRYEENMVIEPTMTFDPKSAYRAWSLEAEEKPPRRLESAIMIDTIHDGYIIPRQLSKAIGAKEKLFKDTFFKDRDWGAGHLAAAIAKKLGLKEFHENIVARNVLDLNRFPGINRSKSPHLDKLAISGDLVPDILAGEDCAETLIGWYGELWRGIERAIKNKMEKKAKSRKPIDLLLNSRFIRLSIHTFDKEDVSGRRRPMVSIVHRSGVIETTGRLPAHVFHHLYPPELATFTADRMLKSALSCGFETHYIPEHSDSPYMHPEGGVEMRIQAWLWFRYLRLVFEEKQHEAAEKLKEAHEFAYNAYWEALTKPNSLHPLARIIRACVDQQVGQKVNLRCSSAPEETGFDSMPLRLGRGGENSDFKEINLKDIWKIEDAVSKFYADEGKGEGAKDGVPKFVLDYQYAPSRPSTLVIEVRKDELYKDFNHKENTPGELNTEFVDKIANSVLKGLTMYEDLWAVKNDVYQQDLRKSS